MVTQWELKTAAGKAINNAPGRRIGDSNYRAAMRHAIAQRKGTLREAAVMYLRYCGISPKLLTKLIVDGFGGKGSG